MDRDNRIDFLRGVAILLIILAHVFPPPVLFALRMFDVPLMTLLLGMSYYLSRQKHNEQSYHIYITKRFKRLVLPAWFFITLYITLVYFLKSDGSLTIDYIVNSYKLSRVGGMSYVWIIGVFFVIALVSPVLEIIANSAHKLMTRLLIISIALWMQRSLVIFYLEHDRNLNLENISMYFAYCIIALIGMWVVRQNVMENMLFATFFLTIFVLLKNKKGFIALLGDKYPPGLLYISYGVFVSILLFILLSNQFYMKKNSFRATQWLSDNSLRLYYWHIIILTFVSSTILENTWQKKFIFVLALSIIGVFGQNIFNKKFGKQLQQQIDHVYHYTNRFIEKNL